jgi:hypothetical protein
MAAPHLEKVRDMFERYDIDHDDSLTINEVATLLAELGNKITSLPAVCSSSRFTAYTDILYLLTTSPYTHLPDRTHLPIQ